MLWALRRNDPQQWLPATAQRLEAALQLIAECDGGFKANLDRYKYPNRYSLPDGLAHRALGAQFLQTLNEQLSLQPYLTDEHFGLTDAAIAPFVRQFAHTDAAWFSNQPWPNLQRWLQAFEVSGDYAKVMEKFAAWTEGQSLKMFPV
jgi:glutathione S-transferase